ncbi:MAG: MMPL family transporter [Bacteroidales bacterium]|nr:MMPL family transporter [Bacteroidales bacterium]
MKGLVLKSYDYFSNHRLVFWLVMLLIFILLVALSLRVSFEEDISKMLQMDARTREYRKLIQNTRLVDKLVISISDESPVVSTDLLKMAYCDSMLVRLQTIDSSLVKKVISNPDDFPFMEVYKALLRNLPFFVEEQDYAHIDSILRPETIQRHLAENTKLLSSPAGILIRQSLPLDPAGISGSITLRLQKLGEATGYEINDGYFFTKDKKNLVLFIEPANAANETSKNAVLIKAIEDFATDLKQQEQFKNIKCGFMGATAVSVGNARQIQRDTILTLAVLCIALIILITFIFRKKRTPFLIFLPIIFGMAFALACISFIEKDISLIAIGASSVLLGIAVNYPLHILTHRLHEKDLRKVIGDMVEPMTIGSATTIGGFICLLFVKAEILHDFGLLGAFGLIGAVVFSLIFLPHLIGKQQTEQKITGKWLEKAGNIQLENYTYLRWSIILLSPVMLYFAQFIEFDSNLLHLNYMSSELKETELALRGVDSLKHSVYVISFGGTLDQALASAGRIKYLSDSLNKSGTANKYTGVADFLPSQEEQEKRRKRWKHYFTTEKIQRIKASLNNSGKVLGFKESAFNDFYSNLELKNNQIDSVDFHLLTKVFAKETVSVTPEMTTIVSVLQVPTTSLSDVEKLVSQQPSSRMLDNKFMSNQLASIINDDFNFIAIFSALLVFVALLLTYGRIELALTAFIPMVVSWVWILGLMGLFHIQFNIVNIILSTFIFGLGDDYCIFTMDGLLHEYRNKKKQMPVIRMSILLSGLTTLIGFGVMLIAKHPALQSIALVSVIGITSVLVISQVLMPFLFRIFISSPVSKGFAPISFKTALLTIFAYTFFITGCLLLSIAGFFLLVLNPFNRPKAQRLFNWMISKITWAQLYVMGNLNKRIIYDEKHDFSKPCIFVANHQSFIDILSMCMLSPKMILLTNNWVWNSPLFGYVVRLAGYYPVFEGAEPGIELLKAKIDAGYSIAVFPEGTRSKDGKIGRFHKGAFYLAQQLELDIVPVILHGTGKCITKGSFTVHDAIITIKVLKRIKFNDAEFGVTYQQKTKSIHQLFKAKYALLEEEFHTPEHFRKRVIDNFLFKGPLLEWYMKVKLRMEDNYQIFQYLVPKQGVIIDAGCGYGFMAYMLAYLEPAREITGFDYDLSKIEVAENGFDKPANLSFIGSNLQDFYFPQADCIIFSDVLHYLNQQERKQIFTEYASKLSPGGSIIVRDGDNRLAKKHAVTRLTEFLSTRILNFNKTENKLEFFSFDAMAQLGESLGFETQIIDQTRWTSNLIMVFKRKNNG